MSVKKNISVVVPLFNEEESLPELCEWIARVMKEHQYTYEIILVDDGSTDASWEVIGKLAVHDENIRGVRFNRNYGKSAALHTGFQACEGEVVITMDADLQDSPDEIPGLYNLIKVEKYDLISGWKKKRYDPLSKTIPTKLFNGVTSWMSGIKLHDFNCGLKAYNYKVVKSIEVYGEMHRYIPVIAKWAGFKKIGEQVVQHRARKYGVTKFGLERFIFGFLDLLSIMFVGKFRKSPMHFFGTLGTIFFLAGSLMTVFLIGEKIYNLSHGIHDRDIVDRPSFYLSLVSAVIGVQLFLAGFLGEMMTMNNSRKNDYLISERIG